MKNYSWRFIAYLDEKWLYHQFSLPHLYIWCLTVGRMCVLGLGVEGFQIKALVLAFSWNLSACLHSRGIRKKKGISTLAIRSVKARAPGQILYPVHRPSWYLSPRQHGYTWHQAVNIQPSLLPFDFCLAQLTAPWMSTPFKQLLELAPIPLQNDSLVPCFRFCGVVCVVVFPMLCSPSVLSFDSSLTSHLGFCAYVMSWVYIPQNDSFVPCFRFCGAVCVVVFPVLCSLSVLSFDSSLSHIPSGFLRVRDELVFFPQNDSLVPCFRSLCRVVCVVVFPVLCSPSVLSLGSFSLTTCLDFCAYVMSSFPFAFFRKLEFNAAPSGVSVLSFFPISVMCIGFAIEQSCNHPDNP